VVTAQADIVAVSRIMAVMVAVMVAVVMVTRDTE